MDTDSKLVYRNIGPIRISTGWQAKGAEATVEVVISRDRLGPGEHGEDIQMELANLLVQAIEKRYHPQKK